MSARSGAQSAPRAKRPITASQKVLDSSNTAAPELSSHKQAIEVRRAQEAAAKARKGDISSSSGRADQANDPSVATPPPSAATPPPSSASASVAGQNISDGDQDEGLEEVAHASKS